MNEPTPPRRPPLLPAPCEENLAKFPVASLAVPLGVAAIGVALGTAGIHVGDTDDAPGAALMGILLMLGMVTLSVRASWRKRTICRRPPTS